LVLAVALALLVVIPLLVVLLPQTVLQAVRAAHTEVTVLVDKHSSHQVAGLEEEPPLQGMGPLQEDKVLAVREESLVHLLAVAVAVLVVRGVLELEETDLVMLEFLEMEPTVDLVETVVTAALVQVETQERLDSCMLFLEHKENLNDTF
jgi:hypothetical protein